VRLPCIPAAAKTPAATTTTANRVYNKANPAVVTIRGNGVWGSGFIVSNNGYVVTNAHVIKGQPAVVTLILADGKTEIPADLGVATVSVSWRFLNYLIQTEIERYYFVTCICSCSASHSCLIGISSSVASESAC
jgi:hypothetical protein